ncbi:MAG: NADH-quinone oxidoreductase subunit C [Acidimicrobiia bacterium]
MSSTEDTALAPATDELRDAMVERLTAVLGDAVEGVLVKPGDDLWVRVRSDAWVKAVTACRDLLAMDYFCFLSGLDWLPSPFGKGEDDPTEPPPERSTAIVQGYAGGNTRWQVFVRLYSTKRRVGITLKADVADDDPRIATLTTVYPGANWHERECWEMYGIEFDGHPNLVNMYLPTEFEGHPLRKDFPLLARLVKPWPGIVDVEPMPGGDDEGEGDAS